MPATIRPIRPDDYAALAVCNCAAMPGVDDTAESLQEDDAHTAAFERWVAEVDGQVVGSAAWFQLANRLHPQKFWMDGAVHPDHQGKGIGSLLLQRVLSALAPKYPLSIRTFSRADYDRTLRFLDKHGFTEAKRTWESFLDLAALDLTAYGDPMAQAALQGIRLVPLTELQGVPDWEQKLLDLYNTLQADVPDFDQAAAVSMSYFRENWIGSAKFMPEGNFIAVDGNRWIGISNFWRANTAHQLDTGLTGVLQAYRRRGIAMALKLHALGWAKQQGVTRIRTTNASTNRGMLAINERLGFAKEPAWIHLVRTF